METTQANLIGFATAIIALTNEGFDSPEQGVTADGIILRGGGLYRSGYGEEFEVLLRLDEFETFAITYTTETNQLQHEGRGFDNVMTDLEGVSESAEELD